MRSTLPRTHLRKTMVPPQKSLSHFGYLNRHRVRVQHVGSHGSCYDVGTFTSASSCCTRRAELGRTGEFWFDARKAAVDITLLITLTIRQTAQTSDDR